MAEGETQGPAIALTKQTPVGFIGAGRLGSSLATAMRRAGYSVAALSSRRQEHREWLQQKLAGAAIYSDATDVAEAAEVIFITTSDSAIERVADSITWRPDQSLVHCSGAAPLDYLRAASATGASIGGFHPLQTFPTTDSADHLAGITFGVEAPDPELARWLTRLATDLGGAAYPLTADQRPAYHTAAVMACGLLAGLTGLAAEVWSATGAISRQQAVEALAPLVKTTANSLGDNGLPKALTGPYVRGDVETVIAHLQATSAVSNEMGTAYVALAMATLHIAKEQGKLTDEAEKSIKEILNNTLKIGCDNIEEA